MGKDIRLHFRLDPDSRDRLKRVCELTGLDEPAAMRACIAALIEYVEAHGEITLPLRVVPRGEKKPEATARTSSTVLLNDPPQPYRPGKKSSKP